MTTRLTLKYKTLINIYKNCNRTSQTYENKRINTKKLIFFFMKQWKKQFVNGVNSTTNSNMNNYSYPQ